jgi:hypothetical protein
MYRAAPGSSAAQIRDALKKLVQTREIEIGLSYHVVFELLQKAGPEHRADRLERARLLRDLCRRNAQRSWSGLWLQHLMHVITLHPDSSRHEQRVHAKRKYLEARARNYPARASRGRQRSQFMAAMRGSGRKTSRPKSMVWRGHSQTALAPLPPNNNRQADRARTLILSPRSGETETLLISPIRSSRPDRRPTGGSARSSRRSRRRRAGTRRRCSF